MRFFFWKNQPTNQLKQNESLTQTNLLIIIYSDLILPKSALKTTKQMMSVSTEIQWPSTSDSCDHTWHTRGLCLPGRGWHTVFSLFSEYKNNKKCPICLTPCWFGVYFPLEVLPFPSVDWCVVLPGPFLFIVWLRINSLDVIIFSPP